MEVDSSDAYNQDNYGIGYGQNDGSNSMRQTMHGNSHKGSLSYSNIYEPEISYSPVKVQNTVRTKGASKMDFLNGNAHVSLRQFASQIKPQIQYVDEVHPNHARVSNHDVGNSFGSSNTGNFGSSSPASFGSSSTGSFGSSSTGNLGSSITGRSSTSDAY